MTLAVAGPCTSGSYVHQAALFYDLSSEIFVPSFLCLLKNSSCKFSLRDPKLEKVFFVLIYRNVGIIYDKIYHE
jgi:hypothetical protein